MTCTFCSCSPARTGSVTGTVFASAKCLLFGDGVVHVQHVGQVAFLVTLSELNCCSYMVHQCFLGIEVSIPQQRHARPLQCAALISTTLNWSVLHECGHEPLQFYWFRAAVRFYNVLLRSNSTTLSK
eukprot:1152345-Pelagomonas_calceolata.AAC.1